jgi:renalase
MKKRIAIIGAGISGLTLAHQLGNHADIVIFEKARGVGGRMSTRYADPFYFDHGAQFFTARSKAFQDFLTPYQNDGTIAQWDGKIIHLEVGKKPSKRLWFEPHWVATPNMNSLCKKLAEGCDILLGTEVAPLAQHPSGIWFLHDKHGAFLGEFDWVISTAPPAQTQALFQCHAVEHSSFSMGHMKACYTLMIGFNQPWNKQWIAAKVRNSPIEWIAINSTKPHRNKLVTAIVVHSRNDWADLHIDDDVMEAQKFLLTEFELVSGINCQNANYLSTHRWKYAIAEPTENLEFTLDSKHHLAATGDWISASRIEDAWLNAVSLARTLISKYLLSI